MYAISPLFKQNNQHCIRLYCFETNVVRSIVRYPMKRLKQYHDILIPLPSLHRMLPRIPAGLLSSIHIINTYNLCIPTKYTTKYKM